MFSSAALIWLLLAGRFENVDNVTDVDLGILTFSFRIYINSHSCVLSLGIWPCNLSSGVAVGFWLGAGIV